MSDSTFGSKTNGGTVYNGPSPSTGTTGTVYAGPSAGGTVYGGPPAGGTVYNGSPYGQAAQPQAGPTTAQVSAGAARGARIFFLIAGFTGINILLMFAGIRFGIGLSTTLLGGASLGVILISNVLAAGLFVVLGILARNGNKAAFLIGIVLYAGDLVLLTLNHPEFHIVSIVVHGLFMFYLFSAFRQLPE